VQSVFQSLIKHLLFFAPKIYDTVLVCKVLSVVVMVMVEEDGRQEEEKFHNNESQMVGSSKQPGKTFRFVFQAFFSSQRNLNEKNHKNIVKGRKMENFHFAN